MITTYERGTEVYTKYEKVAIILSALSRNNARYYVKDVYFDYGQDWMWTTICRNGHMACQVLNPREAEHIQLAETPDELLECVNEIRNGEYFND